MKLASRFLTLLAIAALAIFYSSCKKDEGDNRTTEQKQLEKLNSVWRVTKADDGTDRLADFADAKMTIQGNFAQDGTYSYSWTGSRPNPSPWPASGTWKFDQANPTSEIIRDPGDDIEIDATYEVSDTNLKITFVIPDTWPAGRTKSVAGEWIFEFVKE